MVGVVVAGRGGGGIGVGARGRGRPEGLVVWALTGPTPNPLSRLAHETLAVQAEYTATVQELHLVAVHVLCAGLDRALGVHPARTTEDVRPVPRPSPKPVRRPA